MDSLSSEEFLILFLRPATAAKKGNEVQPGEDPDKRGWVDLSSPEVGLPSSIVHHEDNTLELTL